MKWKFIVGEKMTSRVFEPVTFGWSRRYPLGYGGPRCSYLLNVLIKHTYCIKEIKNTCGMENWKGNSYNIGEKKGLFQESWSHQVIGTKAYYRNFGENIFLILTFTFTLFTSFLSQILENHYLIATIINNLYYENHTY